jgi:hypothetical protein
MLLKRSNWSTTNVSLISSDLKDTSDSNGDETHKTFRSSSEDSTPFIESYTPLSSDSSTCFVSCCDGRSTGECRLADNQDEVGHKWIIVCRRIY